MRKTGETLVGLLFVLALIVGMCGCSTKSSGKGEEEDKTIFAGELVDAESDRLVVKDEEETMVFSTNDDTSYELRGEEELCVGDKIEVSYHQTDGAYIADKVSLTEHQDDSTVFGGEVTELKEKYLTVQSESMTAVFTYDKKTKTKGDLTQGDSVTVTYEGNLSENPKAVSIVVIKENKEKSERSIHGTVSEVADGSAVISVDSAHACRFKITSQTKFEGATNLKVGDEVHLVYTGDIEKDPVAQSIKITRNEFKAYYVMDGVIDKATADSLVVKTATKSYTFSIVKETRIENKNYMTAGHKTTITYAGDLNKKPVAASIFCSKDTVTAAEKKQAAANTTKPAADQTTPAKKEESKKDDSKKDDFKKDESKKDESKKDESKKDDSKKDDSKEDDSKKDDKDVKIEAKGVIKEWKDPCTIKVEGGATLKLEIKDAKVAAGYIPQEDDQVTIIYNKTTMKLIEIKLEYRPVSEKAQKGAKEGGQESADETAKESAAEADKKE